MPSAERGAETSSAEKGAPRGGPEANGPVRPAEVSSGFAGVEPCLGMQGEDTKGQILECKLVSIMSNNKKGTFKYIYSKRSSRSNPC